MNVGDRDVRTFGGSVVPRVVDEQLKLVDGRRIVAQRTRQVRVIEPAAHHSLDRRTAGGKEALLLGRKVALGRVADDLHQRLIAQGLCQTAARCSKALNLRPRRYDRHHGPLGLARDPRSDAAEHAAHRRGEQRREQEENEGFRQDGRREISAGDHEGERRKRIIAVCPHPLPPPHCFRRSPRMHRAGPAARWRGS